jgi:hypothetical protein
MLFVIPSPQKGVALKELDKTQTIVRLRLAQVKMNCGFSHSGLCKFLHS